MPNRMSLIDPRMIDMLEDFFPEECTIKTFTETTNSFGVKVLTPVNFAGHVAIPCRKSPSSGTEIKKPDQTFSIGSHIIELMGYYPTIVTKMLAVIDTVSYDILAVEFDGEHELTRLSVEIAT